VVQPQSGAGLLIGPGCLLSDRDRQFAPGNRPGSGQGPFDPEPGRVRDLCPWPAALLQDAGWQLCSKPVNEHSTSYVTILPGKTIKQIKKAFLQAGYGDTELETAFDPTTYAAHPLLAALPSGAGLEGLLYPDSFQRDNSTPASTIVRESLDEMQARLNTNIINGFSAQGLTEYQGITLASIVYAESGNANSQPTVAQVFLLRLKKGMALGSDVTAFYAADLAGQGKTLGVDSPYNTRIHTGLPPGPIGNFSDAALKAVAQPSNTDYLYFVAGDDGTIHFSHTEAEHEQAVKQYCTTECS
jgi:UPF0755 protein